MPGAGPDRGNRLAPGPVPGARPSLAPPGAGLNIHNTLLGAPTRVGRRGGWRLRPEDLFQPRIGQRRKVLEVNHIILIQISRQSAVFCRPYNVLDRGTP